MLLRIDIDVVRFVLSTVQKYKLSSEKPQFALIGFIYRQIGIIYLPVNPKKPN